MIVEVLQRHKYVAGDVGDEVDIDPVKGNWLATIGVVKVVKHDPVDGKPGCQITPPPEDLELPDE